MHKLMRVQACSPGPLHNVPPYMVSLCGLVGASLSEPTFTVPSVHLLYRLCTYTVPSVY